jgi:sugar phosphate isomerase/epimerase
MYYSGFADEAGDSIDIQIRATLELGWSHIESRSVDGVNLTDITADKFDEVCEKVAAAGVRINCLGSAIANWSRDPRREEDFRYSVEALKRALPRMERLGAKMIRGMSFAVVRDEQADSPELEAVIFDRVRHLVRMCEEAGVLYLHENCMNYGGMSHEHTLRLLDQIRSPNLKLVFDTGNPVFTDRRLGPEPYRKQSSWEFYTNVREWIHYQGRAVPAGERRHFPRSGVYLSRRGQRGRGADRRRPVGHRLRRRFFDRAAPGRRLSRGLGSIDR